MKLSAPFLAYVLLLAAATRSSGQAPTPASAAANRATATQFPSTTAAAAPAAGASSSLPVFTPVTPSPVAAVTLPTLPSPPAAASPATLPSPAAAASPSSAAATETQPQEPTPGPTGTYDLNPFNAIVSCVPFNFLVLPSADANAYSVSSSVNAKVQAAVRLTIEDKTLYLGFNQSFESTEAIRINITLPAGQLLRVDNRGMGDIILNPGFKTQSTVLVARGTGRVFARGLDTQQLEVQSSGSADVFAKGAIATANVTMEGTGRVTVAGLQQSLKAELSGISSLFVDGASDDVTISADSRGISKVYYTRGKCDAGQQLSVDVPFFSMDLGLSSCVKVQGSAFPRYKAFWSCGMKATGASMCSPGAEQEAAAAAEGGDISVQSSTSSDGASGTASSSATSSSSASSSASAGDEQKEAATVSLLRGGDVPTTPEAAAAAEAADISLTPQSGHKRLLKTLLLPPLLPFPSLHHHHGMQPLTTRAAVSSSSSSDDGNGNTVSITVGGNGSSSMSVRSVTCSAEQQDLYISGK